MKILLTGATGFVGSHLHEYLASLDYECDYISRAEFENEDWRKLDKKPDVVIHCAWPTSKDLHSVEHLEFAEWTCNFYEQCNKRGIRVINIGSSSEYGVKYEPMREDMACEPVNTYGIAKLSVTLFAKKLGYNTLRLFSPYGERGSNFASLYSKVEKWGNPKDVRDYQSIELVCHAVQRLIHAQHLHGEIINVCSGRMKSNYEMSKGGLLKDQLKWHKYPQRQYEPSVWLGDNTKMKKLLNV